MRLAVIVDNGAVQRFALDALDAVEEIDEISVFSCTNTRLQKRWLRHAAYYALNLLSVRSRLTRFVPIDAGTKRVSRKTDFECSYEGAWQVLPRSVIDELNQGGFDIALKFGMGLLRMPPNEELPVPILSYHHGDPDRYRGRPAGFWEMVDGTPVMGQIVQVISNRLDAGDVVAYAETRIHPWSYRDTLLEAYRHSPLIINAAIRNAREQIYLPKARSGRNCRLPSNGQVVRFAAKMASRFLGRLAYGAFVEKKWKVSTAAVDPVTTASLLSGSFPRPSEWRHVPVTRGYTFYADPFFCGDPPGILVEALRGSSGTGEILLVSENGHRTISAGAQHMSYPSTAVLAGREHILPEIARWSSPIAYVLEAGQLKPETALRIERAERLIDPTLVEHEGRLYLFGNIRSIGSNALFLWWSESLDALFRLHPASPIRISPIGSRMGGAIWEHEGRLFRFGQDFSGSYGNGLVIFEIVTLSSDAYEERQVGTTRFADRNGPHTLNFRPGEAVFDWYVDRFAPFAGIRRILAAVAVESHQRTEK